MKALDLRKGAGNISRVVKLSSTQASSSATLGNITALVAPLQPDALYEVTAYVVFQSAATTTGMGLGFVVPTGSTPMVTIRVPIVTAGDATTLEMTFPNAASTTSGSLTGSGVTAINSNHTATLTGLVRTGSTAGNLQLQFKSEVGSSAVTLQIGSTMVVKRIA